MSCVSELGIIQTIRTTNYKLSIFSPQRILSLFGVSLLSLRIENDGLVVGFDAIEYRLSFWGDNLILGTMFGRFEIKDRKWFS